MLMVCRRCRSWAGEAAIREASAEGLTPKPGGATETARPSQAQLRSSRAGLSLPTRASPVLCVSAASSLPPHS